MSFIQERFAPFNEFAIDQITNLGMQRPIAPRRQRPVPAKPCFAIERCNRRGQPLAKFPQIPALAALPQLSGFEYDSWAGIQVPKNTPDDVSNRLNKAVYDALQNPDIRKAFEASGNIIVAPTSVAELDRLYKAEVARYQAIAKSINLQPQ